MKLSRLEDRPIAVLITAACWLAVINLVVGNLMYRDTQRMESAAEWVAHTHEVLSLLQTGVQLTERIDFETRMYRATRESGHLDQAQQSADRLAALAMQTGNLVSDNRDQDGNVKSLTTCSARLGEAVTRLSGEADDELINFRTCLQTLERMRSLELGLLTKRTQAAKRTSFVSLSADTAFIGVSVVMLLLMALFWFLIRDALGRQRTTAKMRATNVFLESSVEKLRLQSAQMQLLTGARDEFQLCVDLDQVYGTGVRNISRMAPEAAGTLYMINSSRNLMVAVAAWGRETPEEQYTPDTCCGLRSGQPRWRQTGESEIDCRHFAGEPPKAYLCIPISAYGETLGSLTLDCSEADVKLMRPAMDAVCEILQLMAMAVASLNLRHKLENQAIRDPLTKAFNRHFMQISLERELARASRRQTTLAVFMMDVDHFKRFNDTRGHAAGDAVLRAIAELCRATVRSEDVVCRYGGEEFTIILPDISPEVAVGRAERIRKVVSELRVPLSGEPFVEVTVSIGVALYPTDGLSADVLLKRADEALYRAKRGGRNQVSLSDGSFAGSPELAGFS